MTTEPQTLAHIVDKTREMTRLYMRVLQGVDWHQTFTVDGKTLNSPFWIMAHLAATQNFLLLRSTGGETIKIPWARQFGMGSTQSSKEDSPPIEEVKNTFDMIHSKSVEHIQSMDATKLDLPTINGFSFLGEDSIRAVIVHSIRHEGTHAGHLGWLCKLHGLKTI
jgi:hypothetical protein